MCTPRWKWPLASRSIRDRVVEVPGVLAVDGDDVEAAKVGAAGEVVPPGVHGARRVLPRHQPRRLDHRRAAVRVGQSVLADDDRRVDSRLVDAPEDFDDAPDRPARRRRPPGDLHDHHLPGRRAAVIPLGDRDVGAEALVERGHEANPCAVDVEPSDDCLVGPPEDLDDAALGAVAGPMPLDAHDDAVAVHRLVAVPGGDEDVAAAVGARRVGHDEGRPADVGLETADDEVHLLGHAVAVAADLDKSPVGRQRLQLAPETSPLLAGDPQQLHQLARRCGVLGPFAHEADDVFRCEHDGGQSVTRYRLTASAVRLPPAAGPHEQNHDIPDIGSGRTGDDEISERLEEMVGVVVGEIRVR